MNPQVRAILLAISTLTIMAGATIAPGLPRMQAHFADVPDAGLLVRLVLTIVALSVAIFSPIAGIIADKFGRKPLLIFGLILYAAAGTSGLYLETLPTLLAGRVLLGIAVSSISTALSALVADYFEGAARGRFISLQSAFTSFGGVIFLPLGGILADIGWHMPFAVYVASLAILPFAWYALTEPVRIAKNSISKQVLSPTIWVIYGLAFINFVVFYLGPTQMPFFLQNLVGLKPSVTGYVVALFTLSGAVVALQYSRLRQHFNEPTLTSLGFGLLGAGWLLFGITQNLWIILLGMIISGAGGGVLNPNFATWLANLAPVETRGRILGGLGTAIFLGQFVSPILAQPIVAIGGLNFVFTVGGTFALLTAAVVSIGFKFNKPKTSH